MLSLFLCVISRLYIPTFLKLIIIVMLETFYNFIHHFTKKRIIYKEPKKKQTAVITGGSKGIGLQIVKRLVKLNYKVTLLSRDTMAMSKIQKQYGDSCIRYAYLDLSDLKSIAPTIAKLNLGNVDLLICNAGVWYRQVVKKDDIESNMLINFLGHYVVAEQITARRVVNVSSSVVYSIKRVKDRGYDLFMENYAQSKLANLLHTLYLKQKGINCVAVHPGIVATGLFDNTVYGKVVKFLNRVVPVIFTSVEEAAENVLYACFAKDLCKDKDSIDFYMYGQRAKVPDYVNYKRMLEIMEYAHSTVNKLIFEN